MLCYKDKMFCSFYADCRQRGDCDRPLTAEVIAAAKRTGLPIAQFMDRPECWVPVDLNR